MVDCEKSCNRLGHELWADSISPLPSCFLSFAPWRLCVRRLPLHDTVFIWLRPKTALG